MKIAQNINIEKLPNFDYIKTKLCGRLSYGLSFGYKLIQIWLEMSFDETFDKNMLLTASRVFSAM